MSACAKRYGSPAIGRRAKSWLFAILRNIWLNNLRHRRTAPDGVEFDSDGSVPNEQGEAAQDPYSVYVRTIEREQVQAAIQQLPVEFREIIILREYEELSYQEIAAVLDCPPGTVMSRLARARVRLRELLTSGLVSSQSREQRAGQTSESAARVQSTRRR